MTFTANRYAANGKVIITREQLASLTSYHEKFALSFEANSAKLKEAHLALATATARYMGEIESELSSPYRMCGEHTARICTQIASLYRDAQEDAAQLASINEILSNCEVQG